MKETTYFDKLKATGRLYSKNDTGPRVRATGHRGMPYCIFNESWLDAKPNYRAIILLCINFKIAHPDPSGFTQVRWDVALFFLSANRDFASKPTLHSSHHHLSFLSPHSGHSMPFSHSLIQWLWIGPMIDRHRIPTALYTGWARVCWSSQRRPTGVTRGGFNAGPTVPFRARSAQTRL